VTRAPGLAFRRGRPADAGAVARVMSAAIRASARAGLPPATVAAWSSLPPLYHRWAMTPGAGGETYLLALRGGRVAGYAALRGRELTAMFVHPRHAGHGLGTELVRRMAGLARKRGARTLDVLAAAGAEGFYARAGFRAQRTARVPLPGGRSLAARRMSLAL